MPRAAPCWTTTPACARVEVSLNGLASGLYPVGIYRQESVTWQSVVVCGAQLVEGVRLCRVWGGADFNAMATMTWDLRPLMSKKRDARRKGKRSMGAVLGC